MKNSEEEIFDDLYLGQRAPEEDQQLEEAVANLAVEPLSLIERGVITYNKHRTTFKGLGGAMLGGLGFTAGALAFSHHR